jgi:hypothetical protein
MGGDRTCPDDCPLAVWQGLSLTDRKAQRKPIAEKLYKQGFKHEAIATQLGMDVRTIYRDLETFVSMSNVKGQGKDTLGRKKSTGRGKGTKSSKVVNKHAKIVALADAGLAKPAIAEQTGVGERMVDRVLEVESARREPTIDPATLSMTAQQKLETVERQYKAKLDADFYRAVENEIRKRIDEIILPHWKQQIDQAHQLFSRRKALMDKETFNTIRRALHPDSRQSISDKKLGEAFDAFMALEKFLLNEKDSPTEFPDLPRTWQEWEMAKQKATAARKAKRTANIVRVH